MPSLTIRKLQRTSGVRFKALIRDNVGRTVRSKTFSKAVLAKEWGRRILADRETAAALGTEAATITLRGVVKGDPPRRPAYAGSDQTEWQVNWWLERLGDRVLIDITPDDVRDALNEYAASSATVFVRGKGLKQTQRPRSDATVNRMRAKLGALYRHARVAWGITADSPLRAVPPRREKNRRKVFLSVEQAGKLLEAAHASGYPKLGLLVLMGIATGARRGELEGLRWSDIDFDARTALVRDTKNGDPRVLTVPPDVMTELTRFREVGSGLVFSRPGDPLHAFTIRDAWHSALRAAGLTPWKPGMGEAEGFRFHDLRHSTASFLAARGASLFQIGEVLGHRSSQTTKRYSHLLVEAKQRLTDAVFGDVLAKARAT